MVTIAPYGTWNSPIDATAAVAGSLSFDDLTTDGSNAYWVELRPTEGGRQALMGTTTDGRIEEVAESTSNTRTRVHEYGGAAFTVADGVLIRSEFGDQRLYRVAGGVSTPLTADPPRPGSVRYADGEVVGKWLVCVRETHPEGGEAVNELALIDLESGAQSTLVAGRDFYAAPHHHNGRLAWIEWSHPNMPWDGTELKVADFDPVDGVSNVTTVAGGATESVIEPSWAPDGNLVFGSDRSGFWNLYRWDGQSVTHITDLGSDVGAPMWVFSRKSYGFLSAGRILIGYWDQGIHRLAIVEADGALASLPDDLASHESVVTDGEHTAWFIGAGPGTTETVFELDVDSGTRRALRSGPPPAESEYVAEPELIEFPTDGGLTAFAVFYPPTNPGYAAPSGELPPLVVKVHGGPTGHVFPMLSVNVLYWTSRGFAVVDVNYGGSSGFGRAYRQRLDGTWGLVDVADSMAAARHLGNTGRVDPDRMVIRGGSAGGYTTLAALAFGDVFSAGASYFGVADIELLADHTHKFESRYIERLCGADRSVWKERSPLYSADHIDVPVVLFQGLEDQVVPPEQAQAIADALAARGVPHAHVTYQGEDHGFRKAENQVHSLETELAFYGRVLGFEPAGDLPEVPLET